MSKEDLEHFFRYVDLPGAVMASVVDAYKGRYGAALSGNESLGDSSGALLAAGLGVRDIVDVVKRGNLTALEWVLASSEKRDSVLGAVLSTFTLSERDQMRFVRRHLSAPMAARVLGIRAMCAEAKKVAATRAKDEARYGYVGDHFNCVEDIREIVTSVAGSTSVHVDAGALVAHRELRGAALRRGGAASRAACWMELDPDDLEIAMALGVRSVSGSTQDPLVGLMAQPSLSEEMYTSLWRVMGEEQRALLRDACGDEGPRVRVSSLRDVSEDEARELIAQYGHGGGFRGFEARWNVLEGLSWNNNLRPGGSVARALVESIAREMELRGSMMDRWLWASLARACEREGSRSPEEVLVQFGYTKWGAGRLRKSDNSAHGPVASESWGCYSEVTASGTVVWREHSADLFWRMWGQQGLRRLGPSLVAALGDGSDQRSRATWMAFFRLIEDGPDVALGEIVGASETLALSELVR